MPNSLNVGFEKFENLGKTIRVTEGITWRNPDSLKTDKVQWYEGYFVKSKILDAFD